MNELIIIVSTLVTYWFYRERVYYPDSVRYSLGYKQHYPFNLRVVRIPYMTFLIPLLTYYYLIPFTSQALYGALLVLGLSGIYQQNIKGYKLIDGTAISFGLMSAICFNNNWLVPAFGFLILASLTKETMPVFIALWSMSFIPLIGFIVPLIVYFINPPIENDVIGGESEKYLKNPFNFKRFHSHLLHPVYFLSWGVLLAGLFYTGQYWQWVLAGVLIGYAQLFVATDRARLFQYSFPLVLIAVCNVIELNVFWVLINLYNPYQYIESGLKKDNVNYTKKDFDDLCNLITS